MAKARYRCKHCMNEVIMEVPTFESAMRFGDKVPCTRCGKVGCRYSGSA